MFPNVKRFINYEVYISAVYDFLDGCSLILNIELMIIVSITSYIMSNYGANILPINLSTVVIEDTDRLPVHSFLQH